MKIIMTAWASINSRATMLRRPFDAIGTVNGDLRRMKDKNKSE